MRKARERTKGTGDLVVVKFVTDNRLINFISDLVALWVGLLKGISDAKPYPGISLISDRSCCQDRQM